MRKTVLALAATLAFTGAGLAFAVAPAIAETDSKHWVNGGGVSTASKHWVDGGGVSTASKHWVDGGGVSTASMRFG